MSITEAGLRNQGWTDPLNDFDFVIYLSDEWDRFFKRHQLRALSKKLHKSRFLCVERPFCMSTGPFRYPTRLVQRLCRGGSTAETENLFLFRPIILVHDHVSARLAAVQAINRIMLHQQLRQVLGDLNFRQDHLVSWIYDPFQQYCLNLLTEKLSVYDRYDEYTAWHGVPFLRTAKDIRVRETDIFREADVVLLVSDEMAQRRRVHHPCVHVVHNGVDVAAFLQADHTVPIDLENLARPILGYVGGITSRIDFALLNNVAQVHPEWSLVFVGGTENANKMLANSSECAALGGLPNVHFLGPKPYDRLMQYMSNFNVCLIPYVLDEWNVNCSPLKLYEYLASGRPIVSVDIPEVRLFNDVVRIGTNAAGFEAAIRECLAEPDGEAVQRRKQLASENSWDKRADAIISILDDEIVTRSAAREPRVANTA